MNDGHQLNFCDVVIETDRLRLIPIEHRYAGVIFAEFTEQVGEYLYVQPTGVFADTRAFIAQSLKALEQKTDLQLVILDKQTGEFFGCTGLHHTDTPTPEPGIWLKKSAQGKGYGFEVIAALKQWANEHLVYEYLVYPADKENVRSWTIAVRLGGTFDGEFQKPNSRGIPRVLVRYHIGR
jgi:RimJ/RimL family protein N-acetyltransferase